MKPILKILIPVFFIGAIGVFVAFKSGAFDTEQPVEKSDTKPTREQSETSKLKDSVTPESTIKVEVIQKEPSTPKKVHGSAHNKKEEPETTQNVNVTPVVMPSSKSVIMVNPTKSRFEKYNQNPAPKKQKVMPSTKSGVMINP